MYITEIKKIIKWNAASTTSEKILRYITVLLYPLLSHTPCLFSFPHLQVFIVEQHSYDCSFFVPSYPGLQDAPDTQVAYGVFP